MAELIAEEYYIVDGRQVKPVMWSFKKFMKYRDRIAVFENYDDAVAYTKES